MLEKNPCTSSAVELIFHPYRNQWKSYSFQVLLGCVIEVLTRGMLVITAAPGGLGI